MSPPPIRLAGVTNFRDFGGQPTRDGRTVVTGQLFRSGHFNTVSAEDSAWLNGLGARFLVDLRLPGERTQRPNVWSPELTLLRDPATTIAPPPPFDPTAVGRPVMQATYARIPHDPRFIGLFGDLFRALAGHGGPAIVHCAQGKDRTGIACALVLDALGVDRALIFEDYLATNATIDHAERAREVRERLEPMHGPLSDDVVAQVVGVEASYLQASLDAIETGHGSLAAYVEQALGVTPDMRRALQARFLVG